MINLNFSTGNITGDFSLLDWINSLKRISSDAIELGFTRSERIPVEFSNDIISSLKDFKSVFIHAPVKHNEQWINYPSKDSDKIIETLKSIISRINIKAIVFHPDLVKDFEYLSSIFGDKLAFENMDSNKSFGIKISDMQDVFEKCPNAKWVCDINHLYTNDNSMISSINWHEAFGDRLVYYHISAFGGFHSMFIDTREDIILKGIKEFSKHLIHEGFDQAAQVSKLNEEMKYIKNILKPVTLNT